MDQGLSMTYLATAIRVHCAVRAQGCILATLRQFRSYSIWPKPTYVWYTYRRSPCTRSDPCGKVVGWTSPHLECGWYSSVFRSTAYPRHPWRPPCSQWRTAPSDSDQSAFARSSLT